MTISSGNQQFDNQQFDSQAAVTISSLEKEDQQWQSAVFNSQAAYPFERRLSWLSRCLAGVRNGPAAPPLAAAALIGAALCESR